MDELFINRRCYLQFGDGTVLSGIRLRADCFFRYWPLRDARLDEEGYLQAVAYARRAAPGQVAEVFLHIDPVTGLLLEYRYIDQRGLRVFMLANEEYREGAVERKEGDNSHTSPRICQP
jgi:hypothetical protein